MSTSELPKLSPARLAGHIIAWVIGLFLLLSGFALLISPGVGSKIIGVGALGAGAFTLPPLVTFLRAQLPFLRPLWAPPLVAVGLFFLGSIIGAPMQPASQRQDPPAVSADAIAKRQADVAEIERLLATPSDANVREAQTILRRHRRETREGGELHPLLERVEAARAVLKARGEAGRYVERVAEMKPKVDAIYTGRAEAMLTITTNLNTISDASSLIKEGQKFSADPQAVEAASALRSALAAKQRTAFPAMRASYGRLMSQQLWETDTEVIVQGGGSRTIRLISAVFAANRNIASVQRETQDTLQSLRFGRAQYEWYRGGEATYYTLETPADGVVGVWVAGTFKPAVAVTPQS